MLITNFKPFPDLSTRRLVLRQLSNDDEEEIFKLRCDERVNKFLTRHQYKTLQEARAFINKINRSITNNECIYWAIALKDNPGLIGTICLWNIQAENYRAEIGYELNPVFWGKGIMKEAIPKIIEYGFDIMGLHTLEADIHPENLQSAVHLSENGFIKEGHFKESIYFNGKFIDRIVYSLINRKKN